MTTDMNPTHFRNYLKQSRKGSALLYMLGIILITGGLAVAVISLSLSAADTEITSTPAHQAQSIAESALQYAQWSYCSGNPDFLNVGDSLDMEFENGETAQVVLINLSGALWLRAVAEVHSGSHWESRAERMAPALNCLENPPSTGGGSHPSEYVISGGTVRLPSGSYVDGSIFGETVLLSAASIEVTGNVMAEAGVVMESSAKVLGNVCVLEGNLWMRSAGTTIFGNAYVFGDVKLDSHTFIHGDLYATGDVEILQHSKVGGNVHAGGIVSLASGGEVAGSIYSGESVDSAPSGTKVGGSIHAQQNINLTSTTVGSGIYAGANVHLVGVVNVGGDVHAGINLTVNTGWGPNMSNIGGSTYAGGSTNQLQPTSIFQPAPPRRAPTIPTEPYGCPPIPPIPGMQSFTASSDHITVAQSSHHTLSPGVYGNLFINGAATVTLTASTCDYVDQPGCYIFQSFDGARWGQTLRLDLSGSGSIHVFVVGNLQFSGPVEVSTDGINYTRINNLDPEVAKELARRVYWEVHGGFTITTHNGIRQWMGTVLCQNNLRFPSSFYGVGAYATIDGNIFVDPSNPTIYYSVADFARDNW